MTCNNKEITNIKMNDLEKEKEDMAESVNTKDHNKSRNRVIIVAIVIVALVLVGVLVNSKLQASNAKINYDSATKTLFIYGKDDTNIEIPKSINEAEFLDADFDTFHLKLNLSLVDKRDELEKFIQEYLERMNNGLNVMGKSLAENSDHEGLAERINKKVDIDLMSIDDYSWSDKGDSIELKIGDLYWHHGELYVLSLMGSSTVQWKQLGYAWYVDECVNPYCQAAPILFEKEYLENLQYYDIYSRGGGTAEASIDNFKKINDAIAYKCFTEGMYWGGAPCEDMPVKVEPLYRAPKKVSDPGDDMSVYMAVSFISYLSDKYGFDKVTAFCFSDMPFNKAFGSDYQTEYDSWSKWILETYGE